MFCQRGAIRTWVYGFGTVWGTALAVLGTVLGYGFGTVISVLGYGLGYGLRTVWLRFVRLCTALYDFGTVISVLGPYLGAVWGAAMAVLGAALGIWPKYGSPPSVFCFLVSQGPFLRRWQCY